MTLLLSRRACLLAAACLLGCRSSGTAARGARGQRVVSITPNTTEAIFALGAGRRMVGRSRYCDYPPEAAKLPSVGGYVDPSLEAVLALRPDLVVGARGPIGRSLVDKLEVRGTVCYFPPTESVEEIFAMIVGLAEHLDVQPEGSRLVDSLRDRLQSIQKSVEGKTQPRTLLVFGQAPISVAGPGSFPAEMLALAGCKNAVDKGARYPTLGFETILGLDPDLVIDATMAGGRTAEPIDVQRAGWSSVRAVREGRIVRLDDDRILRPGPRLAEGVALLARHAHQGVQLP
ncbi:MAG: ABC transporter substrate-binding protein [Deltaproteobacteria bacterium HGW-Deltaproteobacteria-20]|jgi:iron complex transport system substrate-binding protein|nr:MAG: ABC transporter substrate-binding protein [Deltaproteobacteria bacterium HGW-Deltaproteobacteria-20]